MDRSTPTFISLTGENSHKIVIPPGQGSFSIGTKNMSKGKYDVLVVEGSAINWDVFNEMYTPHGKQNADRYPNGDWPRFFYYSGDDTGFIQWSEKRRIENLNWAPIGPMKADLSKANIYELSIHATANPIELILGENIKKLYLSGNLANIQIKASPSTTLVQFAPDTGTAADNNYCLPEFLSLNKTVTSVHVDNTVIGAAVDCSSLLQFKNIQSLNLSGNITNLQAIAQLHELEYLGLRTMPDLTGMPALKIWQKLKSFIGWNIEETQGKILQQELKSLLKEREMEYSSVSKLRKKIWFTTEYGIPFTNWEGKNAKIATKAYKSALKAIGKAKTEAEVKQAIIELIDLINTLHNIETVEREDTGTAVEQLVASSRLDLPQELAAQWFDDRRDF
ncbi:hypothetical protein [Sphingobacterium paucimobilis]|uniref:Uncharacterized protein n=1 Tax=Sphingobacterium paucimobilis HER1398 TaxID=1346330 RepID=U2HSJ2_9SPHI|nr:hypothetical protein [Sphingobacterium paucimobilis]ERJ58250.1 hypothetical protein M472_05685 [Sphingobacterium paucimobilis HER1398]